MHRHQGMAPQSPALRTVVKQAHGVAASAAVIKPSDIFGEGNFSRASGGVCRFPPKTGPCKGMSRKERRRFLPRLPRSQAGGRNAANYADVVGAFITDAELGQPVPAPVHALQRLPSRYLLPLTTLP